MGTRIGGEYRRLSCTDDVFVYRMTFLNNTRVRNGQHLGSFPSHVQLHPLNHRQVSIRIAAALGSTHSLLAAGYQHSSRMLRHTCSAPLACSACSTVLCQLHAPSSCGSDALSTPPSSHSYMPFTLSILPPFSLPLLIPCSVLPSLYP